MISIEIISTAYSPQEMAELLREIANQIEEGYTSGIDPIDWGLIVLPN